MEIQANVSIMLCVYMNKQMVTLWTRMWKHHINMLVISKDLGQAHIEAL